MKRASEPRVTVKLLFFLIGGLLSGTGLEALEFSTATHAGKRAIVCRLDLKTDTLRLFLRDERGQPLKSFEALQRMLGSRGQKLLFAMNAGMYHADLSPVGLCVVEGQQLAPLNLKDGNGNFYLKPNGVFLVMNGRALVMEASKYGALTGHVSVATQSGPLLVADGQIHPKFAPTSTSRLIRNGVGVTASGEALFAVTESPMSFYEFATLFRDVLKCPDALYLDGVVSSLHAPALKRSDKKAELGPIIGVAR